MAYYTHCDHTQAHVIFFYRDVNADKDYTYSHIGLGVGAMHAVRVLRKKGIRADVHAISGVEGIRKILSQKTRTTHAVIEAPWIKTSEFRALINEFSDVHFIVRCHSQIGFLQVEAGAIKLIREYIGLQDTSLNLTFSGNSRRFCKFMEKAYRKRCVYLPNLYDAARPARRQPLESHRHRVLRIASFGAIRVPKNHTTAAAAALLIARHRDCDLEFHLSVNREEHGSGVLTAVRNMFRKLPFVKLVEVPWEPWDDFRQIVAGMDLCMQISATETFNIVTADATAEGVPSVVSHAIEWMPESWMAHVDDVEGVARVGNHILSNVMAGHEGLQALSRYVRDSTRTWIQYLKRNPRD